jgi:hypothetical protein
MIDERLIDLVIERLITRIEDANTYILQDIGKSIKQIRDITPTKRQQLINILKYSDNYQNILNKISKMTNLNIKDVEEIFLETSKKNYEFAEQFYKARNITPVPFKENVRLIAQAKSIARIVQKDLYNFTRENMLGYSIRDLDGNIQFYGLRETYNRVIEESLINITQGKETFNQSMTRIMKDIGGSGLKKIDYQSGRSMRLDSSVRMHLQDGLRTLFNQNQELFGEEFDYNGIEVTHHQNSAPDHIDTVDGKQFVLVDKVQEQINNGIETKIKQEDIRGNQVKVKGKIYDDFNAVNNSLERQVSTLNCRHRTFSIVVGVSKPEYTQEQLDEDKQKNIEGFDFDGKHYTLYEGEQLQRSLERKIREQKDIQIIAKASGNKELVQESQQKITQLTHKYKQLSNVSGLPTKMERMRVSGYKRVAINKIK